MKNYLIIIGLFLTSLSLFSQENETNDQVAIVANWSIGDTFNYTVTRIKETWKEGELDKLDSIQYQATLEVLDANETSYTLKWLNNNEFAGNMEVPDEMLEKLKQMKSPAIIYQTDETGEFVEVKNMEEISQQIKESSKVMASMFQEIMDTNTKEGKKMAKNLENIMSTFSSEEAIMNKSMIGVNLVHAYLGYSYSTQDTLHFKQEYPNFISKKPITGLGEFYVESYDQVAQTCTLIENSEMDSEEMKAVLMQFFKSLKMKNNDFKKAMKTAKYDIKDEHKSIYSTALGILKYAQTKRTLDLNIQNEVGKNYETYRVELIE